MNHPDEHSPIVNTQISTLPPQIIGVSAIHQDEIQTFTTYCDPKQRVEGGFRLGFVVEGVESDSYQTTRVIPASTLPESLEQVWERKPYL